MSQTQDIVIKINILLQEIRDIKKQKQRNNIFNVHKTHPKGTDEGNVQDDTCQGITPSNSKGGLPAPEAGARTQEGGIRAKLT